MSAIQQNLPIKNNKVKTIIPVIGPGTAEPKMVWKSKLSAKLKGEKEKHKHRRWVIICGVICFVIAFVLFDHSSGKLLYIIIFLNKKNSKFIK